ncbi:Rid family detoxifying hydrolase [Orrella sp. 11846]|uniref:Rid family detoxifying hydrolase n=1 Tax=Orrella sp. 11846 TaxID=3409913 RepID=UPI003B5CA310
MSHQIIHSDQAPSAVGPYSQAVGAAKGTTYYLSGQIGLEPQSGSLVESSFHNQVRQAFDNLLAVIEACGAQRTDVVKLTLYLTDLSRFGEVNTIMAEVFDEPYPARSTLGVSSLPKGASFEVDAVVVV